MAAVSLYRQAVPPRYAARARSRRIGFHLAGAPVQVIRDDGNTAPYAFVISQADGAMSDASKPWSSSFVPPSGSGPVPDSLKAAIRAAVDQADAWLKWSQHYGLNWVITRAPAGGGTAQVLQQATPTGPVLVTQPIAPVSSAPPQVTANGTAATTPTTTTTQPAPAAAASWFSGSTEILGLQVPNVALAGALAIAALLFMGGEESAGSFRRGRR